jgi:hypothetical protein
MRLNIQPKHTKCFSTKRSVIIKAMLAAIRVNLIFIKFLTTKYNKSLNLKYSVNLHTFIETVNLKVSVL